MFRNQVTTQKKPFVALTAASTLAATQSGMTFGLPAVGFATTLPAPASGLEFTFICQAACTTTSHTIVTDSSTNVIVGVGLSSDVDGSNIDSASATPCDTVTITASKALHGDSVYLFSDGTYWYGKTFSGTVDGITYDVAS